MLAIAIAFVISPVLRFIGAFFKTGLAFLVLAGYYLFRK